MIKDVMVRLEGTTIDEPRLAAASCIAAMFDGQVTGLFLNLTPIGAEVVLLTRAAQAASADP
jgi:hypothetical protein